MGCSSVRRAGLSSGILAAAAALLAVASPAWAAFPGKNGRIFATSRECDTPTSGGCEGREFDRVAAFRPNGTGYATRDVLNFELNDVTLSPDGRRLAVALFTNAPGAQPGIYLMSRAELLRRAGDFDPPPGSLVPGTRQAPFVAWSQDGQRLAAVEGSGLAGSLVTMALDGSDRRQLVAEGVSQPVFSANGDIASAGGASPGGLGRGDIYIIPKGETTPRRLTHQGGSSPDWSPAGGRLVFVRNGSVYFIGRNGKRLRRLRGARGVSGRPLWSPDGKWIAYVRGDAVVLRRPDGSAAHSVRYPRRGRRRGPRISADSLTDWQPLP